MGKSSLINALRRAVPINRDTGVRGGKPVRTGPLPGVTRNNQTVRIGETLYLTDTPGIMEPK